MNDVLLKIREDEVDLLKQILFSEQLSKEDGIAKYCESPIGNLRNKIVGQADVCHLMMPFTIVGEVISNEKRCLKKIFCMAEDASDAEMQAIKNFETAHQKWRTIFVREMEARDFCSYSLK